MPDTPPTATVAGQSIALHVTGYPDIPNRWGAGHIRATAIRIDYGSSVSPDARHVFVTGLWIREDGEATDDPVDRYYDAPTGDTSDWPDWIAELARKHTPTATVVDQTALLDVAAQAIRDSNGSPEAIEWWRTHPQLIPAHVYAAAVLAVLPPPADRAAVLLWAAAQIDAETRQLKADGVLEPDRFRPCRDASEQLRRLADEAQQPAVGARQPDTETPTAYGDGRGRVFCLACPRPADPVPLTVEDVDHWELCPSCGRHVIDVATAAVSAVPGRSAATSTGKEA